MKATKKRIDSIKQLLDERNKIDEKMFQLNNEGIVADENGDDELSIKLLNEWCEAHDARTKLEKIIAKRVKNLLDDLGFEVIEDFSIFYYVEQAVNHLSIQFDKATDAFHSLSFINNVFKNKD